MVFDRLELLGGVHTALVRGYGILGLGVTTRLFSFDDTNIMPTFQPTSSGASQVVISLYARRRR